MYLHSDPRFLILRYSYFRWQRADPFIYSSIAVVCEYTIQPDYFPTYLLKVVQDMPSLRSGSHIAGEGFIQV
jgi:hypothetical protein